MSFQELFDRHGTTIRMAICKLKDAERERMAVQFGAGSSENPTLSNEWSVKRAINSWKQLGSQWTELASVVTQRNAADFSNVVLFCMLCTPRLYGHTDVSNILGISKQAFMDRRNRGTVPEPAEIIGNKPFWDSDQLREMIDRQLE